MYNMYLSLMKDVSDTNTFFSTALAVRQVLRTQLSVDHWELIKQIQMYKLLLTKYVHILSNCLRLIDIQQRT